MTLPPLTQLQAEITAIEAAMSQPETVANVGRMKELAHEHRTKTALRDLLVRLEATRQEQAEVAQLLAPDMAAELRQLAADDTARLTAQEQALTHELTELLLPRDPRDARDVILEIRAGTGGEEASLFAAELFRAYARYAEIQGWKLHTVSTSPSEQGGFKEVIAELSAPLRPAGSAGQTSGPFGTLKFERGVHRVQRVPVTEKMGRTHTSTVTVAVLPQAEEVDLVIRPEDLRIDTYRSGGAGGQHVNKTSSAVRITHLPTNTVVAVQDERSQHKNKDKAMSILRSRLLAAQEEASRQQAAAERKAQVGTGERSEKIRTYNFPQDRITDHRIKESWSNIPGVLDGAWQPIFDALHEAERTLQLEDIT